MEVEVAYKVSLCQDVRRVGSKSNMCRLEIYQKTNQFETQGDIMRHVGVTTHDYGRHKHGAHDDSNVPYLGGR